MLGVVKVVPDPKLVPPVEAANQLMVEDGRQLDCVTDNFRVPVPHRDAGTGVNACGTITVTAPETLLATAGEQIPATTQ